MIVVKAIQVRRHQLLPSNALAPPKKELDARLEQQVQVDAVTTINQRIKKMKKDLLFALDTTAEEVIVSESSKGSFKVNFIERLGKKDNEMLYFAVQTLTSITKDPKFDAAVFKAMDKVCQMIYNNHRQNP